MRALKYIVLYLLYGAILWLALALWFGAASYMQELRATGSASFVGHFLSYLETYGSTAFMAPFVFGVGRRQANISGTLGKRLAEGVLVVLTVYLAHVSYTAFYYAPKYGQGSLEAVLQVPFISWAWDFVIMIAILAGGHAVGYFERSRANMVAAADLNRELAEARAELAGEQNSQLRQRLGSHFILNGLGNISALVRRNRKDEAIKGLDILGELLRSIAHTDGDDLCSLEDELNILEQYIAFQNIRYPDLRLSWDIAPEVLSTQVPSHILQPLVENAFKHGMSTVTGMELAIRAEDLGEQTLIQIKNSLHKDRLLSQPCGGEGHRLTHLRLQKHFGESATLKCEKNDDVYIAKIHIPKLKRPFHD